MDFHQQKQNEKYTFGEKSKIANWILNHPFQIAAGCTLLSCIITFGDKTTLMRTLLVFSPVAFGLALLVRLLCSNLCYRIEIDAISEKIVFFRCFNKGVIEAPIQAVEFRFDKHFVAIYNGERFTMFNEYMTGIAQALSPEKQIKFSKGIYARFMKRQLEKRESNGVRP